MNEEIKAASVDSPEFHDLAMSYRSAVRPGYAHIAYIALLAHINAWSDERCNTAINQLAASRAMLPVTDSQVRFCPHCGLIGEPGKEYRDCCPDGNGAFMVPPKFAEQCRATFKLAIESAATPSPVPADTAELPPLPEPLIEVRGKFRGEWDYVEAGDNYYTADQMRNYARAAIASRPAPVAAVPEGWKQAAAYIEKKAQDYLQENAESEHDTGATVFRYGEAGRDYYNSLVELADELRAAAPSQPDQSAQEVKCACGHTESECTDTADGKPLCSAAPSAAQAAGVDAAPARHAIRNLREYLTNGGVFPNGAIGVLENFIDATTPSEGVAAPVEQPSMKQAVAKVLADLKALSSDELRAELDKHSDGSLAVALREASEFLYPAQPSADQGEPKRKILPEPGSAKPEMLLYIDAINGEQVSRDDLWIVTTEVVNRAASADQVRDVKPRVLMINGALELCQPDSCGLLRAVKDTAPIPMPQGWVVALNDLRTTPTERSDGETASGEKGADRG